MSTAQLFLSDGTDEELLICRQRNGSPSFFGRDLLKGFCAPASDRTTWTDGSAPSAQAVARTLVRVGEGTEIGSQGEVQGSSYRYYVDLRGACRQTTRITAEEEGEKQFTGGRKELVGFVNERRSHWNGRRLLWKLRKGEAVGLGDTLLFGTTPLPEIDETGDSRERIAPPTFDHQVKTWMQTDGTLARCSVLTDLPQVLIDGGPSGDGLVQTGGILVVVDWAGRQAVSTDGRVWELSSSHTSYLG
jgi:hypothetical protein